MRGGENTLLLHGGGLEPRHQGPGVGREEFVLQGLESGGPG